MTSARTRDRLVQRLREQGIANLAVLDRIRNVPRHIFVDEALGSRAYEDTALPIGFGQTISQPYIVARMTEALLEGGTAREACSRWAPAAATRPRCSRRWSAASTPSSASSRCWRARASGCKELGIRNVRFRHGDGTLGWKAHAPFDGILVAAAPLTRARRAAQAAEVGGRLVVPVGPEGEQQLVRFTRREQRIEREPLGPVAFVPLLGGTA